MSTVDEIEELASLVVRDAKKKDVKIETRIDALKTLTPYWTILAKERAKAASSDDESTGLDAMRRDIDRAEAAANGSSQVRDHRGD